MPNKSDLSKGRCGRAKCKSERWENTSLCLQHYVYRGLRKFNLLPAFDGDRRPRKARTIRHWLDLREHYVAFFSQRAKGLVAGSILPVSDPKVCIAIALSIHPKDRPFELRLGIADWLRLIEYIWQFDHRIQYHVIQGRRWWGIPVRKSHLTKRIAHRGTSDHRRDNIDL